MIVTQPEHSSRIRRRGAIAVKVYVTEQGFRMVGKAWEVRSKLRDYCQSAGSGETPLSSLLPRPAAAKAGGKERKGRCKP
jgi:hypothetical protein